jgi:hypothetical protein
MSLRSEEGSIHCHFSSAQFSSVRGEFSVAVEDSPHRNRLLSGCSAAGGERGNGRGADCWQESYSELRS